MKLLFEEKLKGGGDWWDVIFGDLFSSSFSFSILTTWCGDDLVDFRRRKKINGKVSYGPFNGPDNKQHFSLIFSLLVKVNETLCLKDGNFTHLSIALAENTTAIARN